MPCGKKRKRAKIATHKRKKKLRRNRHKSKLQFERLYLGLFPLKDRGCFRTYCGLFFAGEILHTASGREKTPVFFISAWRYRIPRSLGVFFDPSEYTFTR